MKKKSHSIFAVLALALVIAAAIVVFALIRKYTPSKEHEDLTTYSPPSIFSCIPPQVPTRKNVCAPHLESSSMAIAADGPPIPVEVTLTLTPSNVPV